MSKGRPKAYESITYEELGDYVGKKGVVKVSKPWLDSIMGEITPPKAQEAPSKLLPPEPDPPPSIEYTLTTFNESNE